MANIFFSAGEPSGDLHAARLIAALRQQHPQVATRGFGGSAMAAVGMQQDYDLTQLALIGFAEVLPHLRQFFRLKAHARSIFRSGEVEAVVLVDYPGFNWHVAAEATAAGIPVFYFLPPQLWAWGSWRIAKLKRTVQHVFCSLPMEAEFFAKHDVDHTFIGHPFLDHLDQRPVDAKWLDERRGGGPVLAVLPGSRNREIDRVWPLQLAAIRLLSEKYRDLRFAVACLSPQQQQRCQRHMDASDRRRNITLHVGRMPEVLELADCVLMKSGSSSLEVAARGKPAVVCYQASRTTYAIARRLTDVRYFSLPNLIADSSIMPEHLSIGSSQSIVGPMAADVERLLFDVEAAAKQRHELADVIKRLGGPGATQRAAGHLLQTLWPGRIAHNDSVSRAA